MERVVVSSLVPKDLRINEALKTLRTNLMFSGPSVRVVGFTSYGPGEGKSTLSLQTAISFAHMGKRVLLVDADLRKSVLAGQLRIRSKVEGLSHYLSGLACAITGQLAHGIMRLTSGATSAGPSEQLMPTTSAPSASTAGASCWL